MSLNDYLKLAREAKERADKATLGPWYVQTSEEKPKQYWTADIMAPGCYGDKRICWGDQELGEHHFTNPEDAEFIAAARSDVPALAHAVEGLIRAFTDFWLLTHYLSREDVTENVDVSAEVVQGIQKWLDKAEKELKHETRYQNMRNR